jgi:hypothetical protein
MRRRRIHRLFRKDDLNDCKKRLKNVIPMTDLFINQNGEISYEVKILRFFEMKNILFFFFENFFKIKNLSVLILAPAPPFY